MLEEKNIVSNQARREIITRIVCMLVIPYVAKYSKKGGLGDLNRRGRGGRLAQQEDYFACICCLGHIF
jgi:hypothetical protein